MPHEELGRRAVLVGAGCGILALLGACSAQGTSTPPTAAALPDGGLAKVTDVPVGGGVLSSDGVLVLQLKAGQFTAYEASCPHEGILVSPPDSSGVITC